ncbi:MAG: hypothetical protein HZC38_19325, partial [Chloroflexi bacterium]|nr:hypothetical protein [Chloroflexota bacterium]
DAADSQSIALDDLLNDPHGAVMIEWAARVQEVLPNEYLQIDLVAVDDQTRQVKLEARGEQYKKIVESLVLRDM